MMFKGLGRSPLGPRTMPPLPPTVADAAAQADAPPEPAPAPEPPPPPPVARGRDAAKIVDPAAEKYETLKHHIHMRLVDRLDLNRVGEMEQGQLRSEIRGVVEHLCDTENP